MSRFVLDIVLAKIQDHQTGDQVLDLFTRHECHLFSPPAMAIAEEMHGEEAARAQGTAHPNTQRRKVIWVAEREGQAGVQEIGGWKLNGFKTCLNSA